MEKKKCCLYIFLLDGFNFKYYFAPLSSSILALFILILLALTINLWLFPILCIFFPYKKCYFSLSLSLKIFFFMFVRIFFSCICTLDWWIFVFFITLILVVYDWKIKSMKNNVFFKIFKLSIKRYSQVLLNHWW